MARIYSWLRLIVLDTLGVLLIITALLTGWLPGPGGIPLFIIGLSLLAINHEWAKRYIDLLRKYADRVGDIIFTPGLNWFYNVVSPVLLVLGIWLLVLQGKLWMISLGVFCIGFSLLFFFGNQHRWQRIRDYFFRKRR